MRGLGPLILSVVFPLLSCASHPPREQTPPQPRQHAEEQFQTLTSEESRSTLQLGPPSRSPGFTGQDQETEFLVAAGRGDLKKGALVCARVADTAARAELAKQIRVFVKEHAVDRVRERSGQPLEQDIEIVREEIANELLQDVKIIDRSVDEAAGTCSSTAVMPKSRILRPSPDTSEAGSVAR